MPDTPVLTKAMAMAWLLAFLVVLGLFLYEALAPCGLRSMKADTAAWVMRGCGRQ